MVLSGEEMQLLESLVGRKAERIIVPVKHDSVSKPVETILVLSKDKGIKIDSCYRPQQAIETPQGYPQMRVRLIHEIPQYANGEEIDFSDTGEIVRSVKVTSERVNTPSDTACYTKAIHIEMTGARDVTITRETFRSPSLRVYEHELDTPLEEESNATITQIVQTF
ncbi:MAG: hypothetical protein ACI32F_02515 [Allobaculum sp.]